MADKQYWLGLVELTQEWRIWRRLVQFEPRNLQFNALSLQGQIPNSVLIPCKDSRGASPRVKAENTDRLIGHWRSILGSKEEVVHKRASSTLRPCEEISRRFSAQKYNFCLIINVFERMSPENNYQIFWFVYLKWCWTVSNSSVRFDRKDKKCCKNFGSDQLSSHVLDSVS